MEGCQSRIWTYWTQGFTPLSGPGSWCFCPWEWLAVGLVNGKAFFEVPFTIREQRVVIHLKMHGLAYWAKFLE